MSDAPHDETGGPADPFGELLRALMAGGAIPPGMLPEGLAALTEGMGGLPPGLAGLPGVPSDPVALQAMLAQVQRMLSTGGDGPVNWDLARDVARQAAAEGGDPSVTEHDQRQVAEALRTADLWLDRACDLPSATARTHAWSRAEWVEATLPTWQGVVEPVATSVGDAMAAAMSAQAPEELRGLVSGALPMMRRMGGAFFGAQVGQAIGALAREVVGSADIGLPLLDSGRAALLPANLAVFGEGLGLPDDEVRLYMALREVAHARLFAGVPWLRPHLLGAVGEYARGIEIDTDKIEEAVSRLDPSDTEALQQALAGGLFEPGRTPGQQAALDRLETALALVEGWVDEVVNQAARTSLPHAAALRETVRRRRAAGGPAEHTFAALVGLELRPRRLREAAAMWSAVGRERGAAGRDAVWAHPDLLPDASAMSDPEGFAAGALAGENPDMDAALAALLDEAGPGDVGQIPPPEPDDA